MTTRATLLLLLCCSVACKPSSPPPPAMPINPGEGHLNFLSMGDWGRDGIPMQRQVASALAAAATLLDPEFVLIHGDNFYPDGVQSTADPHWRRSLEDVYTQHSINVDWFVALGNHDYRGNPEAQVEYSSVSRRWRMPARYFSVTKQVVPGVDAQFLIIDTTPFIQAYRLEPAKYRLAGTDTARQRRWIDSTLRASSARWKFIVGHHHVFSAGSRPHLADMERLIAPLMKTHDVTAYLSGHEHHLEHLVSSDSLHFFISGAAAEGDPVTATPMTQWSHSGPGFLAMSLSADSLLVQAIRYDGTLLDRSVIRRPLFLRLAQVLRIADR